MATAGAFKPGNPGGPGRGKGNPNKITKDLRQMILGALAGAGGMQYLIAQAKENPQAFLALLGKVVPREVDQTMHGLPVLNILLPTPGPAPEPVIETAEQRLQLYSETERLRMNPPVADTSIQAAAYLPPATPVPVPQKPADSSLWNERFLSDQAKRI